MAVKAQNGTEALSTFGEEPLGFVVGAEGTGVAEDISALAALRVRIPMAGEVESLNVAVAAGICLYEAVRQRRH